MPSLKQLTAKIPTLKQLKEQFTELTGLPANKANAFTVCADLGDRKMTSKSDWDFAITNIIPEKTLKYQQDTVKDLIKALESQTDKLVELNAIYEAGLQTPHDDALSKLKIENEKLKASAEAFKASNALYHEDFHNQLDEIEQLKTENERLKAMDRDSDEIIAKLRDEIKFLNGELAKALKKPIREIQLEKRIQDLEDEVYELQRELRNFQHTQETASLDSIPTVKAFADFCYALPLEWVSVFVHSFLANSSDLKATYRELSRKFHPDMNPNNKSSDLFRTLRECYEVLKDSREVVMSFEEVAF